MDIDLSNITAQNDAVFKMIFTDPKHKRVLIHFLNSAINSGDPITDVEILNGELTKEHISQKGSRLDIRARTNRNEIVNIEMQVGTDVNMIGRTLFYWSRLFAGELKISEDYGQLYRTISINILNFKLFKNDARYWRRCYIADEETHEKITDLLEIQFVELDKLKKFTKESPLTFWIEFFRDPYSESAKELYKFVPELQEAKEVLEASKSDPEKRQLIIEREEATRNYNNAVKTAETRGRAEGEKVGLEKGLVEGEKVGLEKGLVEGEKKAKIESARKMLIDGLPIDMVAKYSGLSLEEVEDVK